MQKMGYFGFKIQQNLKTMCSQRTNVTVSMMMVPIVCQVT